jgi:predicted glutamine amidotransferase
MCVICIKKKGIKFPSVETVETMCGNNPDGFSMVLSDGKHKPAIIKTLNMDKFLQAYKKAIKMFDYKTSSMYIHARIKTHGTQRIENCHGWKENGQIFAHNGVLSIANRDDMTDSETFFRDIFSPIYRVGGWKMAEKSINAVIGTSKFVFMNDKGDIRHFGNYIEDNGLLYSNQSYEPYKQRYVSPWYYPTRYQKCWSSKDDWNKDFLTDDYVF